MESHGQGAVWEIVVSVLSQLHNCMWLYWTVVSRMAHVECDTRSQMLTLCLSLVFVVADVVLDNDHF